MSQTTDQTRGKSAASVPGRKTRSARTPRGASSLRPSAPSPPKRRRPALTALAVLLIVGGAALAGLLAVRMDSREPVLVVSQQISVGEKITADMLESRNVSGDGLGVIPRDQADKVIGKLYAAPTIYPGQLLQAEPAALEPAPGDRPGPGRRTPHLREVPARPAQRRRRTPDPHRDSQNPSQALCTGLVIDVDKAKSSGFGSDARASVATVVVPQDVADQVVGATGTDELGIALIGRGIGIDEAEIADLTGGR